MTGVQTCALPICGTREIVDAGPLLNQRPSKAVASGQYAVRLQQPVVGRRELVMTRRANKVEATTVSKPVGVALEAAEEEAVK